MSKIIEAIYEEGVLKPLKPLEFEEHAKVRIKILTKTPPQPLAKPLEPDEIQQILELARASYEGLSEEQKSVIEGARFDRVSLGSSLGESK